MPVYQTLKEERALWQSSIETTLSAQSTLPDGFPLPTIKLEYVSYLRLKHDKLFATNIKGMTGFPSLQSFDDLFDLLMAYSNDVTPRAYRSMKYMAEHAKSNVMANIEDITLSKDKLFFCLYTLRTGPNNMALTGICFGWDSTFVERWYTAWIQFILMILVVHFPQPTAEMILSATPPAIRTKYPNYGGSFDATEMISQVPSNPMAQRAMWSEYKHRNTVKFLILSSPCGACIYVSPGFPGRISDYQIVDACLHLDF